MKNYFLIENNKNFQKTKQKTTKEQTSKNKFLNLNFNLKNEIFAFLKFRFLVETLPSLNKLITEALNKNRFISCAKQNFKVLSSRTDFTHKDLLHLQNELTKLELTESQIFYLCAFFLTLKYCKRESLLVSEGLKIHVASKNLKGENLNCSFISNEFVSVVYKSMDSLEEINIDFNHKPLNYDSNKKLIDDLFFLAANEKNGLRHFSISKCAFNANDLNEFNLGENILRVLEQSKSLKNFEMSFCYLKNFGEFFKAL